MNGGPSEPRFVLASASTRRLDLLRQIGLMPDLVDPAELDERPRPGETPQALVARLAAIKAGTVARRHRGALVLGADTVVACGRRVLPKVADAAEARRCLELLSGRRHRVYGGVCVVDPEGRSHSRLAVTTVQFKRLDRKEIEAYVESGEWRGKAGGYAIQGRAATMVRRVNGSFSNVIGLPLYETATLLAGLDLRPRGWA